MTRTFAFAVASLSLMASPAAAQTPQAAAERMQAFLDRFPEAGPGYAVVAVSAEETLLMDVRGEARAATGAPLTADTPIYIASQTKAFMGLLAARLDAEGVLSLDSTLADHWPDLALPGDLDASDWTLRDLLSHQLPIDVETITTLEAYVTRVDPADYPGLIAARGEMRDPGFDYSNLGYNIYGAILETVTGRTWQDWLDAAVLDPLGLDRTGARTSDFDLDDQAWGHIWTGQETGWFEVRPKTDAQMQSAGGMTMAPADMAVWLQTQLRGAGPDGSGLTQAVFDEAHAPAADVDPEARNAYELPCDGYALGWNVCDFEGHALYIHGGGYTGARTMMAFSPDLGVGVASFSNSDKMTGWLTSRTVIQFLQFVIDHEDADRWADTRAEQYPGRVADLHDWLIERREEARGEAVYQGWDWSPAPAALAAYVGTYVSEDLYAPVTVRQGEDGALTASWGDYALRLEPAAPDVFGGTQHPMDTPELIRFDRDADGAVEGLIIFAETRAERR